MVRAASDGGDVEGGGGWQEGGGGRGEKNELEVATRLYAC